MQITIAGIPTLQTIHRNSRLLGHPLVVRRACTHDNNFGNLNIHVIIIPVWWLHVYSYCMEWNVATVHLATS